MIRKSQDKRLLPRPILREDNNIKMDLKEIQYDVSQDKVNGGLL
jgi:hypothetical protein